MICYLYTVKFSKIFDFFDVTTSLDFYFFHMGGGALYFKVTVFSVLFASYSYCIPLSHFCENVEKYANTITCKKIQRVQSIRYLDEICTLIIYLNACYIYISFYQAVLQYGVKIWGVKKHLVGSTVHNYKELNVLPFKLIYQKFAILRIVEDKRINKAYNAPVAYTNTTYGQRFLDYLGPTIFNSMNNELKNIICVTPECAKKLVSDWLFTNMAKL
ncbi:Uncharacterized protein FWK35_00005830 [Aphis craccivora]|uniref:Uncharacterized protein n=1 Tax=Aphis craccivora TaxID=307492 RepID=A0A6G0ZGM7_APHCR|nr:Uncharacterized protein FWK35_00005830 [Aphis craccivora]